jgi:hypothetical protein
VRESESVVPVKLQRVVAMRGPVQRLRERCMYIQLLICDTNPSRSCCGRPCYLYFLLRLAWALEGCSISNCFCRVVL